MKRGTPRHRKMRRLADCLGIPLSHAVGIMEMLWHYAGTETPEGDIGTATDKEIAEAVTWDKKPHILIEALVSTGWLDKDDTYRLIIHDWPDHAEQAVRKWLDRRNQKFLQVYPSTSGHRPSNVRTQSGQSPPSRVGWAGLGSSSVENSEKEKAQISLMDEFDRWIALYPKQVKIETARASWALLIDHGEISEESVCELFAGLARWKKSAEWARDDGQYIPMPHVFLTGNERHTGRLWLDHPRPLLPDEKPPSSVGSDPYREWVIPPDWKANAGR